MFYVGVTSELARRLTEHRNGRGGGFSSQYRTNKLIYAEEHPRPRDAIAREKEIKGWRRVKKLALVRGSNPVVDLAPSEE